MYDDIVCKYHLPLPEDTKGFNSCGFQTKDFDNALDCYEIREDGTLWLRECEREYTDGDPNGKTFLERFGIVKVTKVWWTHVKLTKSIDMYTYQHGEGEYDYWVVFSIEFVDGVINKINLVKFDAKNNSKRKENDRQFIEELKLRKQFESTLRYKLIYRYYNKLINFICTIMNRFSNFLANASCKIRYKLIV